MLQKRNEDSDPAETQEWLDALDAIFETSGSGRCVELLRNLNEHARLRRINLHELLNTPYWNTIPPSAEPAYPGDIAIERRITAIVRWNALAMVVRANSHEAELGGHLSSYASAADLFEVGFNHFFRGEGTVDGGESASDLIFFQPHSAPGIYARGFVEGRLTEQQLSNFRREVAGNGLSSYPHPWLMPDFWQFPTGSMGLGPIMAIYQARFLHYLVDRGVMRKNTRKVWVFVGDGEMDEPESIAGLSIAARENLDNLIFVVNCNLQRLDGPVRGNGSIIQELERLFAGAGWNVIKILWGTNWDKLFAEDSEHLLLRRFQETVDGELQSYAAQDATFNRKHFFNRNDALRDLASQLSDSEIDNLMRGGHDPVKIFAAFNAAVRHQGQPTVILAQTKKGYGLGRWAEGRMSAHQQKKLANAALLSFRDRFELPLSDEDAGSARFYRPNNDSAELQYLLDRRSRLGGSVPSRRTNSQITPDVRDLPRLVTEPSEQEMSTTMAFVRLLNSLLKDPALSSRIVPIVADEARTFGMESLFRKIGIYSHCGQLYEPQDKDDLLYYKESRSGQILEEGITEAGALASWIAAGTAYAHHGVPTLPFYIFYSVFGFQRVGDLIWAAADSRARGFLLGATAGRTTLSGEGLQHQDGTSHLLASTVPNCRSYDPCFAYELAVILETGLREILNGREDLFYYVTLMNEKYVHPVLPKGAEEGIIRGMYQVREGAAYKESRSLLDGSRGPTERSKSTPRVQLLGSGTILREALRAAELLEKDWDIAADVWSVTSFTELRRSGMETERSNRLHTSARPQQTWVEECLAPTAGPIIAVSDYVRAVPDLIRTWVPRRYISLGTDGFGRSDTREALRRFFEIDYLSIALSSIHALSREGTVPSSLACEFVNKYSYGPTDRAPWMDHRDKLNF